MALDRRKLIVRIQSHEDDDQKPDDVNTPEAAVYANQADQPTVSEVLVNTKDKFEVDVDEPRETEANALSNSNLLQ